MVKAIERHGIPAVHICAITPISQTVGANRIVPGVAIPYPVGNPCVQLEAEKELRYQILWKALNAVATPVGEQTVF